MLYRVAATVIIMLGAAGCGGEPPDPLGPEHVIEVAREFDVLNPMSDEALIEISESMCAVLDEEGAPGGFDTIESIVFSTFDDSAAALAMFIVSGAAVRGLCPDHNAAMEEWTEGLRDE